MFVDVGAFLGVFFFFFWLSFYVWYDYWHCHVHFFAFGVFICSAIKMTDTLYFLLCHYDAIIIKGTLGKHRLED